MGRADRKFAVVNGCDHIGGAQVDRVALDLGPVACHPKLRAIDPAENAAQPSLVESFTMLQDENDGLLRVERKSGKEPLDALHRAGGGADPDHQRGPRPMRALSPR